jgi:predicted RNA polymerase sigma factor
MPGDRGHRFARESGHRPALPASRLAGPYQSRRQSKPCTATHRRRRLPTGPRSCSSTISWSLTNPSPVVALHRAVAVAETDGPQAALAIVDSPDLDPYYLLHAVCGELLHRRGRDREAAAAYKAAIERTANTAEQNRLRRNLRALRTS